MEIELRFILLSVGMIILLVVGYDFFRRNPSAERKQLAPVKDENNLRLHDSMALKDYNIAENDLVDVRTPRLDFPEIHQPVQPVLEKDSVNSVAEYTVKNLINIYIMSRDQYGFEGADLLSAFTTSNLYFGKNNIFHRHAQDNPDNEILFSVANAIEPGHFYLETLPNEHVQGLVLILLPEQTSNPSLAFEQLIRTAKQLAFVLNGELLDHKRFALTLPTIATYRTQAQRS